MPISANSIKDKAIILRRKPMGEADLLLTIYGEKTGKVRVVAKGARKITSKLLGFTELFTFISCQINFRSSIPIISQVSHERLFDGIDQNQLLYKRLHIVAELIDRGCEDQQANALLFHTVLEGMDSLVTSNHPLLLAFVVLRLTTLLGFSPQLTICAHCGKPITSDDSVQWSQSNGGIISCGVPAADAIELSRDEVKVLRYLATAESPGVVKLRLPDAMAERLERLLMGHVQYVLEQDFMTTRATGEV